MGQSRNARNKDRTESPPINDIPVEEALLIRQRLSNLCELAVAIGQKRGLLGNCNNSEKVDLEGGNYVADKGSQ